MNYATKFIYLIFLLALTIFSCQSNAQKGIDLSPAEFKTAMVKESNAIILDVRTPKEVAQGIIPGATVINFYDTDFKNQIEKLDKNKTYFVYCKGGGRSSKACSALQEVSFPKAYNLKGGITAWKKEGLATTKG